MNAIKTISFCILLTMSGCNSEANNESADTAGERQRFENACSKGDAKGCFSIGNLLLYSSDSTPADLDAANIALVKACDGGVAAACSDLGF
ncbi:MAG: hypothetical protein MO852_17085, partial [Candidatus Devosia euplotis]|nr:hypothetical protein [Candidatus Devosia euplotis]